MYSIFDYIIVKYSIAGISYEISVILLFDLIKVPLLLCYKPYILYYLIYTLYIILSYIIYVGMKTHTIMLLVKLIMYIYNSRYIYLY